LPFGIKAQELIMRLLQRIAIGIVLAIALLGWIVPAGAFLYFAKTAPAFTKVVPKKLNDGSLSLASGTKLSHFGYEFALPWSDLDESKTQVSQTEDLKTVWVEFRSGLKLFLTFHPKPPADVYPLLQRAYAVTPDQIHYWGLCTSRTVRQKSFLLLAKSTFLREVGLSTSSNPAESGIFDVQSPNYKGFQYGDPNVRPDQIELSLYADDAQVKVRILQGSYEEPSGVTQPEINRIIQCIHKSAPTAELALTR
jgi:hypothetical protein